MARTDRNHVLHCPVCGIAHRGFSRGPGFRVNWVRPRNKAARKAARLALSRGAEPEPARHRHSALWDYF
jgi:hypothetical protein